MKLSAHPPERRRRGTTLAAHGCCCCCCCCLHTLGGITGAAVEGAKTSSPEGRRTVRIYWWTLLATTVLGIVGYSLRMPGEIGVVLVLAALAFPLAQLNASFLTLLISTMTPLDLRVLGRLTWKAFLWAFVGAAIMLVPLLILSTL